MIKRRRTMFETLILPFSYNYMFNAIWVSSLVGGVCAFLSAYLMLKGWSLIGDALSHAIVPGVAGAFMLGLPFSVGAFFSGGLASSVMLFLSQRSKLKVRCVTVVTVTVSTVSLIEHESHAGQEPTRPMLRHAPRQEHHQSRQ